MHALSLILALLVPPRVAIDTSSAKMLAQEWVSGGTRTACLYGMVSDTLIVIDSAAFAAECNGAIGVAGMVRDKERDEVQGFLAKVLAVRPSWAIGVAVYAAERVYYPGAGWMTVPRVWSVIRVAKRLPVS